MHQSYETGDITILLAELQPFVLRGVKTVLQDDLTRAIATVVQMAVDLEIPVISSTVPMGPPEAPVEMIEAVKRFPPVIRNSVGLLDDGDIAHTLEKSGRRVLALGGASSEIAILHTALSACKQDYEVYVVTDCCGGLSPRTEAAAFRQMERAGAQLSNLSSFFTGLVPQMDHPHGVSVFTSLGRHWGWQSDPPPSA